MRVLTRQKISGSDFKISGSDFEIRATNFFSAPEEKFRLRNFRATSSGFAQRLTSVNVKIAVTAQKSAGIVNVRNLK